MSATVTAYADIAITDDTVQLWHAHRQGAPPRLPRRISAHRRTARYPSEPAQITRMLGICHFWVMKDCESTQRMAFLSAEPCIKEELPGAGRKASRSTSATGAAGVVARKWLRRCSRDHL
jgi:hypothetical protein